MTDVPSNLIPTRITQLPEYTGSSQEGFLPYVLEGVSYKVQFSNVASAGEVPPSRTLTAGTGLAGGGDLSANRVFSIADGGVGASQLDTTGVVAGVYGDASNIPSVTVDANGRVTSVTTNPVVATGFVPETRTITAGAGLTGGGSLANNITLAVNLASVNPQALGTATAGVSTAAAREDHVHPAVDLSDMNETQGALPLGRGGTGDALSPVAGAVVYSTGTKFALTSTGLAGQVLTSDGTGQPSWTTLAGSGTVTSVDASGGSTGLTFSGGPITIAGTLTLGGTLAVGSGGTGTASAPLAGQLLIGNGTGYTLSTLTAGTGVSISNAPGAVTITNSAPDQTVSISAGTAIDVTGTYPNFTVTNTAPDLVVALNGAGTTVVSGTYPNFTITSTDQFVGTVTSVNVSGGTTGLSFSGGPVTSSGTITIAGTLAVANGGTGSNLAPTNGQLLIGNGTGYTLAGLTAGTGVSVTDGAGTITVTNTAPDQVISLTGAGTTVVSGAYPSFTITSNDAFVGTVTSVSGTGSVNGITLTGTVTSSGSLTLGGALSGVSLTTQVTGTLPIANGGTNATATPTAGAVAYGTGTAYAFTTAGTAGQVLVSNGSSAPSFGGIDGGTF